MLKRQQALVLVCLSCVLVLLRLVGWNQTQEVWSHGDVSKLKHGDEGRGQVIYLYVCPKDKAFNVDAIEWAVQSYANYLGPKYHVQRRKLGEDTYVVGGGPVQSFILYSKSSNGPTCLRDYPEMGQDLITGRLTQFGVAGEVFAGALQCGRIDSEHRLPLILDRSKERELIGCERIHAIQGLSFASRLIRAYRLPNLCLKHDREKWRKQLRNNLANRTGAVLLATSRVIKRSHHPADALVRTTLFTMLHDKLGAENVHGTTFIKELSKERGYTQTKCAGNDLQVTVCKRNYKFSIDMENTSELGYISEKLFTGLIANTVPIYFGAPDVDTYMNPKRFIWCNLPSQVVAKLREKKTSKQFLFEGLAEDASLDDVLDKSREFLRPYLDKCVDQVVNLLENEDQYLDKLMEPVFKEQEKVCGQTPINIDVGQQIYKVLQQRR